VKLPSRGKWLLKVLARSDRFVLGVYRRHMKVIGYLGTLDRLYGEPVTTRSWKTIGAIGKLLVSVSDPGRGASRNRLATAGDP
jgi:hypothetical protein